MRLAKIRTMRTPIINLKQTNTIYYLRSKFHQFISAHNQICFFFFFVCLDHLSSYWLTITDCHVCLPHAGTNQDQVQSGWTGDRLISRPVQCHAFHVICENREHAFFLVSITWHTSMVAIGWIVNKGFDICSCNYSLRFNLDDHLIINGYQLIFGK